MKRTKAEAERGRAEAEERAIVNEENLKIERTKREKVEREKRVADQVNGQLRTVVQQQDQTITELHAQLQELSEQQGLPPPPAPPQPPLPPLPQQPPAHPVNEHQEWLQANPVVLAAVHAAWLGGGGGGGNAAIQAAIQSAVRLREAREPAGRGRIRTALRRLRIRTTLAILSRENAELPSGGAGGNGGWGTGIPNVDQNIASFLMEPPNAD